MEDIASQDRILPRIVDLRARATPDRTIVILPKGNDIEDGFYRLTYAAFARAVNAAAWWMDDTFGRVDGTGFPPIAYLGANDLRYPILIHASIKTHRKFMIPLVYNTPEAQVKLLNRSNCRVVLASEDKTHLWDPARAAIEDLRVVDVPALSYFLDDAPVAHYPYEKTYDEAKSDPAYTIQTSGTTGDPKPLDYNNKSVISLLSSSSSPSSASPALSPLPLAMPTLLHNSTFPNFLPLSWGAGVIAVTVWPLVYDTTTLLMPARMPQPLDASYAARALAAVPRGPKNGVIFIPDTLKAFARDPSKLEILSAFDWVGYAGAPLDPGTGDLVAQHTRVQSFMGATDVGAYPLLLNERGDWKVHRFHPTWLGFRFERFQEDLFELVTEREGRDDARPCFAMDPGLEVYHTRDLWRKVPGRVAEGFWMTAGRMDDFVKLASMTKFNASQLELVLDRHPGIEKCVVAGDGRARPFVLVQLREEGGGGVGMSRDERVDRIWAAFEEANAFTFGEAQLTRELIVFTEPERPLKQTAKGTVNRRASIQMYEEEIEVAYRASIEGKERFA